MTLVGMTLVGTSDQKRSALEIVVSGTGEYGPQVHCACAAPFPASRVPPTGLAAFGLPRTSLPLSGAICCARGRAWAQIPGTNSEIGDGAAPSPISESGTGTEDGPPQCGDQNRTKT